MEAAFTALLSNWRRIAIAGATGLAFSPLLLVHFRDLWQREHYQYFPIVLIFTGLLLRRRWREAIAVNRPFTWPDRALIALLGAAAVAVLVLATVSYSPNLAMLAAILAAGAFLVFHTHRRHLTNAFGIWCLLWLLIRLPFKFDETLVKSFQTHSTAWSSRLLDHLGILHRTDGHVLCFPGKEFFVDQACSGIMSFTALFAAAALLIVGLNRPLVTSVVLLTSVCFWTMVMNITRITSVAIGHARWGIDLSEGWRHDAISFLTFAIAIGGLLSTDGLLRYGFHPIPRRSHKRPLIRWWNRFVQWGPQLAPSPSVTVSRSKAATLPRVVLVVTGLLASLQVSVLALRHQTSTPELNRVVLPHEKLTAQLNEDALRGLPGSWELIDFDTVRRDRRSPWGAYSHIWTYQKHGQLLQFSIDYPFYEAHDVGECYENRGWLPTQRNVLGAHATFGPGTMIEIDLHKPATNEHAYALTGCLDPSGDWLALFGATVSDTFMEKIRERFGERQTPHYQIQIFMVTAERLALSERQQLYEAAAKFRTALAPHLEHAQR